MAKIFMVHQFPDQIDVAIRRLKSDGHQVIIHFLGLGVRNALAKEVVDVIVIDADRPFLDGKSLCTLIRNDPRFAHIPILLCSCTLTEAEVWRRAIENGAQGGVSCALYPEEMAVRIGQYLLRKIPLFPINEAKRLSKLRSYRILDTATESAFDDLSRVASIVCDTPFSLLSLVDEDRQWFKARVGITMLESPREYAFCAHSIQQEQIFEIPDATVDVRFEKNPLVTDDPKIRFYAGAPLIAPDGTAAGTLCVLDRVPRQLRQPQRDALAALARVTVLLLEQRLANGRTS